MKPEANGLGFPKFLNERATQFLRAAGIPARAPVRIKPIFQTTLSHSLILHDPSSSLRMPSSSSRLPSGWCRPAFVWQLPLAVLLIWFIVAVPRDIVRKPFD
jgi:hypothetical protein